MDINCDLEHDDDDITIYWSLVMYEDSKDYNRGLGGETPTYLPEVKIVNRGTGPVMYPLIQGSVTLTRESTIDSLTPTE